MSLDDLDVRIAKLEQETAEIIDKIRNFDFINGSIDELEKYDIILQYLKERTLDLLDEVEIEELLESVKQGLIDEGYLNNDYEKE